MNTQVDALTHWRDSDDWQLNPSVFRQLDSKWGPHTIDRFASHTNHLLPVFNSRFWCPGTHGVDVFAQGDWGTHINWCNAPFGHIADVLALARHQQAVATIITPFWRSAAWWPAQPWCSGGGQTFQSFVHGCTELPTSPGLFRPGLSRQAGTKGRPNWRVQALRINMRRAAPPPAVAVPGP